MIYRTIGGRDERGSMPVAILLTLVMMSMSALMTPLLLEQLSTTRIVEARTVALDEARSGLETATAEIRNAQDSLGNGLLERLPCQSMSGHSSAITASFQVGVSYFTADPTGQSASWLATNKIDCTGSEGPAALPSYALLKSRGQVSTTVRTLTGIYQFRTTNANVNGGAIRSNTSSTGLQLCLDAGTDMPSGGETITLQLCDPTKKSQKFSYNTDLSITLASSLTTGQPLGMCLDGGEAPAKDNVITLQPCQVPLPIRQEWNYAEAARFSGTTSAGKLSDFCFNVEQPNTPGARLLLGQVGAGCGSVDDGAFDETQSFYPEATTGAGGAGAENSQLMNFGQFSRCIDVTWRDVNMPYLMLWPCKQARDPKDVYWNQRWDYPTPATGDVNATGMISTITPNGDRYCMRSPNSVDVGTYVQSLPCPGIPTAEYLWTVARDTGDYTTSYRIIDGYGHCLAAADQNAVPPDYVSMTIGDRVTKLVTRTCSSSTLQKWNAPAYLVPPAPLRNIKEN